MKRCRNVLDVSVKDSCCARGAFLDRSCGVIVALLKRPGSVRVACLKHY